MIEENALRINKKIGRLPLSTWVLFVVAGTLTFFYIWIPAITFLGKGMLWIASWL
jgi:hypothetical protein